MYGFAISQIGESTYKTNVEAAGELTRIVSIMLFLAPQGSVAQLVKKGK